MKREIELHALLECFAQSFGIFLDEFNEIDENQIIIIEDDDEFIVVDGEEGDHGVIKYWTKSGALLATCTISGDSEDYKFTEDGFNALAPELLKVVQSWLIKYRKESLIPNQHQRN